MLIRGREKDSEGQPGIFSLFHAWKTARPDIEDTEGPFFCTFFHKFWKGLVTAETEGKRCLWL